MHSKKYRQVRKLRSKSKSRRGRSLKGGAATPYMYEDTPLKEGNDLIQIAVTKMDDGKYTFNPIGKNFANYCELAKYYCGKKSLACVRQIVNGVNEKKEPATTIYPSWVDLLGIALVLAQRFSGGTEIANEDDISRILLQAMMQLKKNNQSESLFLSTPTGCLTYSNEPFHDISGFDDYEFNKILTFIKRMIFYCKYVVVPNAHLDLLTFDKIFVKPTECVQHLVDPTKFNENVANTNYLLNRTQFYTPGNLSRAAQASAAPASAAPAPPSSATPVQALSLESRVAKLESEVAALKDK